MLQSDLIFLPITGLHLWHVPPLSPAFTLACCLAAHACTLGPTGINFLVTFTRLSALAEGANNGSANIIDPVARAARAHVPPYEIVSVDDYRALAYCAYAVRVTF